MDGVVPCNCYRNFTCAPLLEAQTVHGVSEKRIRMIAFMG
jgi:hypothetical protein